MNLSLNNFATFDYKSNSQKIRVMSESWFLKNGYCVNCFNILHDFENNKPVADFYCEKCSEEFELKSKEGKFGKKINDGAYKTMIERINSNNNPNLIILSYQKDFSVNDIIAIPKYFFTESIIEKRKALSDTAKRSGWVGCNILISEIPEIGKIFLVKNSEVINKKIVASNWKLSEKFKIKDVKSRGWTFEILKIVEKLDKSFSLEDVYKYEDFLKNKFPENNFIKDKIRQQLQILRDKNYIKFINKGKYIKI